MSSPPHNPNLIEGELVDHDHDAWPFLQEPSTDLAAMEQYYFPEQEHIPMADLSIVEDVINHDAASTAPSSSRRRKDKSDDVEPPLVVADRNAKERVRRMKLNTSYFSLGALLPDPRRSKKRWSAPSIIDKVVEYIPELENEIQTLTLKKENMLKVIGNKKHLDHEDDDSDDSASVMVHSVKRGEVIVQICMNRRRDDPNYNSLSTIVHKLEDDPSISILDASTVSLCHDRLSTFHIHIQIDGSDEGEYNVEGLRAKLISWLATGVDSSTHA